MGFTAYFGGQACGASDLLKTLKFLKPYTLTALMAIPCMHKSPLLLQLRLPFSSDREHVYAASLTFNHVHGLRLAM
jgi:hypothetical protein